MRRKINLNQFIGKAYKGGLWHDGDALYLDCGGYIGSKLRK